MKPTYEIGILTKKVLLRFYVKSIFHKLKTSKNAILSNSGVLNFEFTDISQFLWAEILQNWNLSPSEIVKKPIFITVIYLKLIYIKSEWQKIYQITPHCVTYFFREINLLNHRSIFLIRPHDIIQSFSHI